MSSTDEIKLFKIVSESSVASGIRRIEAVTARVALKLLKKEESELTEFVQRFGVSSDTLPEHIQALLVKVKELQKKLDTLRFEHFKLKINEIINDAVQIDDAKVIIRKIESVDIALLRSMSDALRQKVKPSVVILASVWEDKALIICTVSEELRSHGVDARAIIRAIAQDVEGSGGGRADFAQAGGRNPGGLEKALSAARKIVKEELKK